MMAFATENKWTALLDDWKNEIKDLFQKKSIQWQNLQLPDVEELHVRPPDKKAVNEIADRYSNNIDPELIGFYKVTNGWPLWLGSFWSGIVPIDKIEMFGDADKDGFDIALSTASMERKISNKKLIGLSVNDIRSALLVSDSGARELVLSIPTHEACLYHFDGVRVFKDFYEYMCHQKNDTYVALKDML